MTDAHAVDPIRFLLSREELLFVLDTLQAAYLPGLDADPLGELSPEQRTLALTMAGRALQARELVQIRDGGTAIHNLLLTAVGVCAYAQSTVFIYHWPTNVDLPTRTFCHLREDQAVVHTRPSDTLHEFALMSSQEHLVKQILHACAYQEPSDLLPMQMILTSGQFVEARSLAAANDLQGATLILTQSGVSEDAATAFVSTLADSARVSILQMVKQQNETVEKRDFTILQDGQLSWLLQPTVSDDPNTLSIHTLPQSDFHALLMEWL